MRSSPPSFDAQCRVEVVHGREPPAVAGPPAHHHLEAKDLYDLLKTCLIIVSTSIAIAYKGKVISNPKILFTQLL